jgi:hypothetical protein
MLKIIFILVLCLLFVMAHRCEPCDTEFPSVRGLRQHNKRVHTGPRRPQPHTKTVLCPALSGMSYIYGSGAINDQHLLARPCNEHGTFLPHGSPPPDMPTEHDWTPFEDHSAFDITTTEFVKRQSSAGDIDKLFQQWQDRSILKTGVDITPYPSHREMYRTIDDVPYGDSTWSAFSSQYDGPVEPGNEEWKQATYTFHSRNALDVVRQICSNPRFDGHFDYVAHKKFERDARTSRWERRFRNVMSGQWAWRQSVSR